MDLGKKVRELKPTTANYKVELVIGVLVLASLLVPGIRNVYKGFVFYGIPLDYAFILLGGLAFLHGLIKIIGHKNEATIEIYENGIKIGDFQAKTEDLVVTISGNKFRFSDGERVVEHLISFSKEDYNYLKTL